MTSLCPLVDARRVGVDTRMAFLRGGTFRQTDGWLAIPTSPTLVAPCTQERVHGSLHIYVDDVDAAFARAVDAGCEVRQPLEDVFWGDRLNRGVWRSINDLSRRTVVRCCSSAMVIMEV